MWTRKKSKGRATVTKTILRGDGDDDDDDDDNNNVGIKRNSIFSIVYNNDDDGNETKRNPKK